MKLIIAVAAVFAATSIMAVSTTPTAAQKGLETKNPACVAKCNEAFAAKGRGHMNARSAGAVKRSCLQACPNK